MKAGTIIKAVLWLSYPAVILFGIQYFQPRYVAMLFALLLLIRWRNEAKGMLAEMTRVNVVVLSILFSAIVIAVITNNETLLRLYPALINFGMLLLFGYSLKNTPSIIERFARLQEPNLSTLAVRYTRRVTQIWCLFFIINGSLAVFTALYTSREIWSLYNGFIAYIFIGLIFAVEWLVRGKFITANSKKS